MKAFGQPRRWTLSPFEEFMTLRPGERPIEDRVCPRLLWPDGLWRDVSDQFSILVAMAAWDEAS